MRFIHFFLIPQYTVNTKLKTPKDKNDTSDKMSFSKNEIPKLRINPINIPFKILGLVFLDRRIPIMIPIKIMILP